MIKALFLDVDGVLNSDDYQFCSGKWNMSKKSQIDPTSIPLLNQIIAATNAKIVVSSTWRIAHYDILINILKDLGCIGEIIDRTPQTHFKAKQYRHCQRGMQIQEWLTNNQDSLLVSDFVILDDSTDMGHLSNKLVKTSMLCGIQQKDVDQAIQILNQKPEVLVL
ncbi:MAG TPA: HAD domain-containing protein [Leptospiraceae bacterium]|nr:HAD domain-containing protein [Leptospiraceae bacterium]